MTRLKNTYAGPLCKRIEGFTILELMVVMAILGILAVLTTPSIVDELNRKRANVAISETTLIMDAARSFRSQKGVWPGDATCSNALDALKNASPPYLLGVPLVNKYNSPYSTSCTAQTFSLDQSAVADYDSLLVNSIAGTSIVNATDHRIRTTIGLPGSEPALEAKLSRVATGNAELNRMRTTLFLGGNDIREVNNVDAVNGSYSNQLSSRVLTVQDLANISGALSVAGESQFSGKARFQQEVILGKTVVEGARGCEIGALAKDSTGVTLSCQEGSWQRTPSAKHYYLTAGEMFNVCIGPNGHDKSNVLLYDYPRYQTVCGSRYCSSKGYAFGLVTELGAGFNYLQPAYSTSGAHIEVQCVN
ncbi:prepilin-type N-terminal cleavage/methylation domain-containing protein [Pseudomonas putida]|uniref:type II secretion system protein n=1 Tax=Pseudomonas putida TaxID=303 RepID=UPI0023635733|nr:prepilin-type N-terminal cleavage/methylation domain-containing protein [Pseudomonas putida]MDD2139535.1 prepilin-type N-terminal cleavage/methylation domain-containing protein [Pseudomonas putida]HDS1721458.1 prepilin-type N-terminal cleavage/methylation domain-containing protein [Pseudomonas putida]